jgi:hypothetical protein
MSLIKHYAMKKYRGVKIGYNYIFLISALDGGEWPASLPGRFIPVEGKTSTIECQKLCGPHSESERIGEEQNPCFPQILSSDRLASSTVTKPVMIVRSTCHDSEFKSLLRITMWQKSMHGELDCGVVRLVSKNFLWGTEESHEGHQYIHLPVRFKSGIPF